MLEEHTIQLDDIALNYAEGASDDRPLVLLHGLTERWQSLRPLIPPLATRWRLFAADLRGHGASGRAGDSYRLIDYTADVVGLLERRVPEPAVLLGFSLGALLALTVAAQAPERVRGIILLDPPLFTRDTSITSTPAFEGWFRWVRQTVRECASTAEIVERCREMVADADEVTLHELATTVAGVAPEMVERVLADQLFAGCEPDEMLRRVRCPTLVIRGEWAHGGAMRDEDAVYLQSLVPQAVIVTLRGAGHMVYETHTDRVLKAIEPFSDALQKQGAGGENDKWDELYA